MTKRDLIQIRNLWFLYSGVPSHMYIDTRTRVLMYTHPKQKANKRNFKDHVTGVCVQKTSS